jgi:RHS repeat-associated protein
VTDGEGRIEWSADYSAWGEKQYSLPLNADEAAQIRTDCAIRFQGQYFDAETGLHYNTFRYYDPGCGRFISPDPINIHGGLNLYQYAPNAANWIDPWGWACFAAKRTSTGVERGRKITQKQAQRRLRRGEDVLVDSKKEAIHFAKKVSHGKKPVRHDPHPDRSGSTKGRLPHVHPNGHAGEAGDSHIFYPKD